MKFFLSVYFFISSLALGQSSLQVVASETLVVEIFKTLKMKPSYAGEQNCSYNKANAICGAYHIHLQPYSVSVENNLRRIASGYSAALVAVEGYPGWFKLLCFRRYGETASTKAPKKGSHGGMSDKEFKIWAGRIEACSAAIEDEYYTGQNEENPSKTGATLFTLKESSNKDKCFLMFQEMARRITILSGTQTEVELVTDYLVRLTQAPI